ncbi:hypothetical protein BDZ45DRAFT_727572 [Acephala macrosclerotiorum]|nr:hypothetical protein BDZ45DRAFT_727572 [Acephala macrosclerotiorum]
MSAANIQSTPTHDIPTPILPLPKAPSENPSLQPLPPLTPDSPIKPIQTPPLPLSQHSHTPIHPTIDPRRYGNSRLHPEFEPQYPVPISAYDVRLAKSWYNRIPEQKHEKDPEFLTEGEDRDDNVGWKPRGEPVEDFSSEEGIREGGFQSWR